jgi:hypothetical protein
MPQARIRKLDALYLRLSQPRPINRRNIFRLILSSTARPPCYSNLRQLELLYSAGDSDAWSRSYTHYKTIVTRAPRAAAMKR